MADVSPEAELAPKPERIEQEVARMRAACASADLLVLAAWLKQEGYEPRADYALQTSAMIEALWDLVNEHGKGV